MSMTSSPSDALGCGEEKGDSCQRDSLICRDACKLGSWILAVTMRTPVWLAMDIALYCALALLLSPEARQNHLRVAW